MRHDCLSTSANVNPPQLNRTIARRLIGAWLRDRHQFRGGKKTRLCPICGYQGVMIGVGHPPRWDARCANCGSRERHRLLWLWATQVDVNRFAGKRVLHFAPEKSLRRVLREICDHETADLIQRGVTHRVDITNLPMPDETYDMVVANHVLEHIEDDRQAMLELLRVLRYNGAALFTVPINPTRQTTYEDVSIIEPVERTAHFGAPDHRRLYGLDFVNRLTNAGFSVEIFRLGQADEVFYALHPMECLFVATRPRCSTVP